MSISDDAEARIVDEAEYVEEALVVLSRKRSLDEETYRFERERRVIVEREFRTAIEGAGVGVAGESLNVRLPRRTLPVKS